MLCATALCVSWAGTNNHSVPGDAALPLVSRWRLVFVSKTGPVHCCRLYCAQHPQWRASRERLLQLLEGTLVAFFERIQQASTDDPVTVPSSHWVRVLAVPHVLQPSGAERCGAAYAPPMKQPSS